MFNIFPPGICVPVCRHVLKRFSIIGNIVGNIAMYTLIRMSYGPHPLPFGTSFNTCLISSLVIGAVRTFPSYIKTQQSSGAAILIMTSISNVSNSIFAYRFVQKLSNIFNISPLLDVTFQGSRLIPAICAVQLSLERGLIPDFVDVLNRHWMWYVSCTISYYFWFVFQLIIHVIF